MHKFQSDYLSLFSNKIFKKTYDLTSISCGFMYETKKINNAQSRLFQQRLSSQLNPSHELYKLSKLIEWDFFEKEFEGLF